MDLGLMFGIANLATSTISSLFAKSEAEQQKSKAVEAYKKLLIPYYEMSKRADQVGDTIYTKAMSEINKGAYNYAGAINPQLASFLAFTKMAETRALKETESQHMDEAYNRNIMAKIAEIEAQPTPQVNPGQLIAGGIEGYFAGKQLEMAESLNKVTADYFNLATSGLEKKLLENKPSAKNEVIPMNLSSFGKLDLDYKPPTLKFQDLFKEKKRKASWQALFP